MAAKSGLRVIAAPVPVGLPGEAWLRPGATTWLPAALAVALALWWGIYRALEPLSRLLAYQVLGLAPASRLGGSVQFFLYDTPKVLLLLVGVVFVVGVLRSFFSAERSRRLLAGRRELVGHALAAGLGVMTPFCSCSAVPLFLGFVEVGVPLGVTFSFLIAAPMVNEVALVLLFGLFGWKVALLYLAAGLAIALVAGWVLGRLHLERHVEPWVYDVAGPGSGRLPAGGVPWPLRVRAGVESVREIVGRVWPYVVAGIAVGAGIHGYVPDGLLAGLMGRSAWWSVPVAVLLGVPLYANAAGVIPVVQALLAKGAALGTVLAFMMAIIGLSLPEMIILRKVLRPPLIVTFAAIVAAGILLVGYLFNLVPLT